MSTSTPPKTPGYALAVPRPAPISAVLTAKPLQLQLAPSAHNILANPARRAEFVVNTNKLLDDDRRTVVSALNNAAVVSKRFAMTQKRNAEVCRRTAINFAIAIAAGSVLPLLAAVPPAPSFVASMLSVAAVVYGAGETLARRWDSSEFDNEVRAMNLKDTVSQIRG